MNTLKFTGKVVKLFEAKKITDKLTKREFAVKESTGQYPQTVLFETMNDKCKLLDNIKEGDDVEIAFNLRGREYNSKFYNTINAWSIKKNSTTTTYKNEEVVDAQVISTTDDLPF